MALSTAIGSFNITTAAAGNTVTITPGFETKAMILWWSGRTAADGEGRASAIWGMGLAVSASSFRACAVQDTDTPTTMDTDRAYRSDACILSVASGTTMDGWADVQSINSTQVVFEILDAFPTDLLVSYICLGGDDITAAEIGNFTATGVAPVDQTVNTTNEGKFIFFLTDWQTAASPSVVAQAHISCGAALSSSVEYCLGGQSRDATGSAEDNGYCKSGECLGGHDNNGVVTGRAEFVSFNATPSFTINWIERTVAGVIHYLQLSGGADLKISMGDVLSTTGTGTITETGLAFQPETAMFLSGCSAEATTDTPQQNHEWSVGAAKSASSRLCQAMFTDDGAATAVVGTAHRTDEIYYRFVNNTAAKEGSIDFTGFTSDGFTLDQDVADVDAAFMWYIAFGSTAAAGGDGPKRLPLIGVGSLLPIGLLYPAWWRMKRMAQMRLWLVLAILLGLASPVTAADYYVKNGGSDGAAGTSDEAAWATIAKVNATSFAAGDTVNLDCDSSWRETLTIPSSGSSGNPVIYREYGTCGANDAPTLIASNAGSWTDIGSNRWTDSEAVDPSMLVFGTTVGIEAASAAAVDATNEWFWDDPTNTITVFHVGSPAATVEIATRDFCIVSQGTARNYITIEDLTCINSHYYGIKLSQGTNWILDGVSVTRTYNGGIINENQDNFTVQNSSISYSNQQGAAGVHEALSLQNVQTFAITGNTLTNNGEEGIVVKAATSGGTILRNTLSGNGALRSSPQIYLDAASDIEVAYNIARDSAHGGIGLAIETYAGNPVMDDVQVHHNLLYRNGAGIFILAETPTDVWVIFGGTTAVDIDHNLFYNNNATNWGGIYVNTGLDTDNYGEINIRNNLFFDNTDAGGSQQIRDPSTFLATAVINYNLMETGAATNRAGTNTVNTTNPVFVNAGSDDYHLQTTSPAKVAGLSGLGYTVDYDSVSLANPPSIGPFEFVNAAVDSTPRRFRFRAN